MREYCLLVQFQEAFLLFEKTNILEGRPIDDLSGVQQHPRFTTAINKKYPAYCASTSAYIRGLYAAMKQLHIIYEEQRLTFFDVASFDCTS